jgi:hypothetical protein
MLQGKTETGELAARLHSVKMTRANHAGRSHHPGKVTPLPRQGQIRLDRNLAVPGGIIDLFLVQFACETVTRAGPVKTFTQA